MSKLVQIEKEQVVAKLPSAEFQKICRDLKESGGTLQVKASKEAIRFSVQGVTLLLWLIVFGMADLNGIPLTMGCLRLLAGIGPDC